MRTLQQQRAIYRSYLNKRNAELWRLICKHCLQDTWQKSGYKNMYCFVKAQVKAGVISQGEWLVLNGYVPYSRGLNE